MPSKKLIINLFTFFYEVANNSKKLSLRKKCVLSVPYDSADDEYKAEETGAEGTLLAAGSL